MQVIKRILMVILFGLMLSIIPMQSYASTPSGNGDVSFEWLDPLLEGAESFSSEFWNFLMMTVTIEGSVSDFYDIYKPYCQYKDIDQVNRKIRKLKDRVRKAILTGKDKDKWKALYYKAKTERMFIRNFEEVVKSIEAFAKKENGDFKDGWDDDGFKQKLEGAFYVKLLKNVDGYNYNNETYGEVIAEFVTKYYNRIEMYKSCSNDAWALIDEKILSIQEMLRSEFVEYPRCEEFITADPSSFYRDPYEKCDKEEEEREKKEAKNSELGGSKGTPKGSGEGFFGKVGSFLADKIYVGEDLMEIADNIEKAGDAAMDFITGGDDDEDDEESEDSKKKKPQTQDSYYKSLKNKDLSYNIKINFVKNQSDYLVQYKYSNDDLLKAISQTMKFNNEIIESMYVPIDDMFDESTKLQGRQCQ